jgi:hypothetical protein
VPSFASADRARKILTEMKTMSAAFGTNVQIEGDVGVIRP